MSEWHPGATGDLSPPGFKPLVPNPYSSSYQVRHPTRYGWRPDVAELIARVYRKFGGPTRIHINTYWDHPEGYWRTPDSFDVWGPAGRNDPLNPQLGTTIKNYLFNDLDPPDIDWIIYQRRWWLRSVGYWRPFGYDWFTFHDDHIHVTYIR